ncbi:hypothetical protein ACFW9N_23580 [Streptomyces sp. NPDC059496]|uniref:hypothetical protein n=1 Tax=Streptomyces sp. NPDC059496 TaxID=3346851 RepID=UPI003695FAFB
MLPLAGVAGLGPPRAHFELHGALVARRGASVLGIAIAIAQYVTNVRRPGRLCKDPDRVRTGGLRSWPPSPRTGTRASVGGRSTGNGTTPTSPSPWAKVPA